MGRSAVDRPIGLLDLPSAVCSLAATPFKKSFNELGWRLVLVLEYVVDDERGRAVGDPIKSYDMQFASSEKHESFGCVGSNSDR